MSKLDGNRRVKTGGRKKGTPNKITAELKDCILQAAELAGGEQGTVGYLEARAKDSPNAFLALLGKVLPIQQNTTVSGGTEHTVTVKVVDARRN